jgi:endonuclease/exonuclease/phosphatase (EEP) superfamily protein YafD
VSPLDALLSSILTALGAVGLTTIVRNAPVVRGWVQEAKKPWACNVCMPLYTVAALLLWPALAVQSWSGWHAVVPFAAYGLANLLLDQMSKPPGPPHIPADFFKGEDE